MKKSAESRVKSSPARRGILKLVLWITRLPIPRTYFPMTRFMGMVLVLAAPPALAADSPLKRFEYSEPHLGTLVNVSLYAPDETVANEAARAAYRRLKELNRIYSDYLAESELNQLCQTAGMGQPVKVSNELFQILHQSLRISEATDGAFDVSVGPLVKLWRQSRQTKKLPEAQVLKQARERVDWKAIRLNSEARTVELTRPGMQLDLGGIAKGEIAHQMKQRLSEQGVKRCLIAVAGDICAGDPPPDAKFWRIGIAPLDKPDGPPSRLIKLVNESVSTSGDVFQYVEIDGKRYSHIVDPQTGLGLTHRSSVTIIHPNGAVADALATAVTILGSEKGLRLLESFPEADALIATANGEKQQVQESPRFAGRLTAEFPKREP